MSLTRVSLSMIGITPTTISVDTTISYDLFVGSGQVITIAAGKTLTINGFFTAGVYQVFDTSFGGTVVFGEGAATEYYPEWFLPSGGDFGLAVSKCLTATKDAGAKIVFTKSHDCTTSINATGNHKGWVLEGRGGSGASNAWGVTIAFAHTGVGLDCSDSEHIFMNNIKFKGGPLAQSPVTTIPTVGILFARNAAGSGCGKHNLTNVIFDYTSKFSIAAIYNYGGEEMLYVDCHVLNNQTNSQTVVTTCANPFAVSSAFITLSSSTTLSTTVHKFISGAYYASGGVSAITFYLDGVSNLSVDGPLVQNVNGYALFYINCSNAQSANMSFRDIREEVTATGANYAFRFDQGTNFPYNFIIEGNRFGSNITSLYVADNIKLSLLKFNNNVQASVSVQNLDYSTLNMGSSSFTGRSGGTGVVQSTITGFLSQVSFLGSKANTTINDIQYNSLQKYAVGGAVNNVVGTLTLTANSTTTVLTSLPFISSNSTVFLTPTSSTAAADVASGVYVSSISAGVSFTITHPNNANANKTFSYMIFTGS